MKKTVLKMFGLALSVIMIMAVAVVPSLADEPAVEDVTIIDRLSQAQGSSVMEYANGQVDGVSAPLDTVGSVYDTALAENVKIYASSSFPAATSAGKEPRHYLRGKGSSAKGALGDINYKTSGYNFVRLETDVYIGNATDGIALRISRYNSDDTLPSYDYYIGIGGSSFERGTVTNAATYICKGLAVNKWQRVVIEMGVSTTERDVKFYVDNVLQSTPSGNFFTYSGGKSIAGEATNGLFPEGTYGFAAASESRCVLALKGQKDCPFEVRLHDFSIKASASAYNTATSDFAGYNSNYVYELKNSATLTRAAENNITVETVQAPQIDSEVYTKEVLHLSSASFANGTGGYTGKTYANAGNLPIFSLISGTKVAKLGNVDYSDYNYLRIRFNIFINNDNNGVIIRLSRYDADNTNVNTPDYLFGIGGYNFGNVSYNATSAETYRYRQLMVGKWNDVMLELGVKANDNTMRLYVNGEEKSFAEWTNGGTPTFGVNNGTGYCGRSANRCGIIPKASFDAALDMYLSDVSLTVAKTAYDIENAVYPAVESASEDAVVYGSGIYTRDSSNITNEIFTKGDATSYAGVINDAESGEPARVISYNNAEKTFKYYNIVTEGFITRINSADYSGEDTDVNAMVINVDGNIKKATLVVAYYKENEGGDGASLVMAKFFDENISNLYSDINETADKPEADFDYVKVFALRGVGNMKSIGRARSF